MMRSDAPKLGKLTEISDVRSVWPGEATHFTPWLAVNLAHVEDAIGLTLTPEGTEQGVGPFRADIVCRDDQGRVVVIENQLEATDHSHLGQLITYGAGLGAKIMIWITARFTDEHRAAIDWLNANSVDDVEFFALQIGLWQIDDSAKAVRLRVVCQPNNWQRAIAKSAAPVNGSAGARHLAFWTGFGEFLERAGKPFRASRPSTHQWTDVSLGNSVIILSMLNRIEKPPLFLLYIKADPHKRTYQYLFNNHKTRIDQVLSPFGEVTWRENPGRISSIVQVARDVRPDVEAEWPATYRWLVDAALAVQRDLKTVIEDVLTFIREGALNDADGKDRIDDE